MHSSHQQALNWLRHLQVDDDMFGAGPAAAGPGGGAVKKGLLDNYDDVEGYYNFQASLSLLGSAFFQSM